MSISSAPSSLAKSASSAFFTLDFWPLGKSMTVTTILLVLAMSFLASGTKASGTQTPKTSNATASSTWALRRASSMLSPNSVCSIMADICFLFSVEELLSFDSMIICVVKTVPSLNEGHSFEFSCFGQYRKDAILLPPGRHEPDAIVIILAIISIRHGTSTCHQYFLHCTQDQIKHHNILVQGSCVNANASWQTD